MNPQEIAELLKDSTNDLEFAGFPQEDRGWYVDGVGAETRAQSEARAAKFYLWLCEYLDQQLLSNEKIFLMLESPCPKKHMNVNTIKCRPKHEGDEERHCSLDMGISCRWF
jgi:hypothetical protein